MTTTAIPNKDKHTNGEGDARGGEDNFLWPRVCVACPWRQTVLSWESLGGVENGERGRKHGKDDQTAAEVDTTEGELCHTNSSLDSLLHLLVEDYDRACSDITYQILNLLLLG